MKVSVEVDKNKMQEVELRLGNLNKKAPDALYKALNRAATTLNASVSKELRKDYHIKAGDVRETLSRTKASKSNLSAAVRSRGGVIPLDKFKVSPKTINPKRKSSIKVAVKKSGVKPIMGAFMADINGPKLFERTSDSRLPIRRLFGPSVPQMLANDDIKERVETAGQEMFEKRLDHEIKRILERGR